MTLWVMHLSAPHNHHHLPPAGFWGEHDVLKAMNPGAAGGSDWASRTGQVRCALLAVSQHAGHICAKQGWPPVWRGLHPVFPSHAKAGMPAASPLHACAAASGAYRLPLLVISSRYAPLQDFATNHASPTIDYATVHMWPGEPGWGVDRGARGSGGQAEAAAVAD